MCSPPPDDLNMDCVSRKLVGKVKKRCLLDKFWARSSTESRPKPSSVLKVPCSNVSVSKISKGRETTRHGSGTNLKHLNDRIEREMSSEADHLSQ